VSSLLRSIIRHVRPTTLERGPAKTGASALTRDFKLIASGLTGLNDKCAVLTRSLAAYPKWTNQ